MSTRHCGLRFPGRFRSFPKSSMHLGSHSVAILRGIVNNLQLKCGIECSLFCSDHSQSFAPCLRTCSCCHHTTDDIMNVIKSGIYLRAATILLCSSSGAGSIRGWPLNVALRLFEQIQYVFPLPTALQTSWGCTRFSTIAYPCFIPAPLRYAEHRYEHKNRIISLQNEVPAKLNVAVYDPDLDVQHHDFGGVFVFVD